MTRKQTGQSILEVVFSVGLISLVTAGVVMLLSSTLGTRTKETDRKKAVEMSQTVMEGVLAEKNYNAVDFWNLGSNYWNSVAGVSQTLPNYPDYDYIINFYPDSRPGCSSSPPWVCANVNISVGFSGTADRPIFTKFFSRQ